MTLASSPRTWDRNHPVRIVGGLVIRLLRRGRNRLRVALLRLRGCHCESMTYIHPAARFSNPANVTIGPHCAIGKCHFYALGEIVVGERSIIGDDVFLCTGSHDIYADDFHLTIKPIIIGSGVWIATGGTILPGVHIGAGAVVGAKAVVSRDVPAGAVVVGNPAQVVKTGRPIPSFDPITLGSIDVETSIRRLRAAVMGTDS